MDPSLPAQNSFEVPSHRPPGDMIPLVPESSESEPASPEVAHNPTAAPSLGQPAQQSQPTDQTHVQTPPLHAQSTPVQQSAHPAAPAVADDLDLIEKEWVNKAKAIVAQTRTDPFVQNKEMNHFKADYMKKRYNKDIKVAD